MMLPCIPPYFKAMSSCSRGDKRWTYMLFLHDCKINLAWLLVHKSSNYSAYISQYFVFMLDIPLENGGVFSSKDIILSPTGDLGNSPSPVHWFFPHFWGEFTSNVEKEKHVASGKRLQKTRDNHGKSLC